MRHWFTTYTGADWTPQQYGYNSLFAEHVQVIRDYYRLRKQRPGAEIGTGYRRQYSLQGKDWSIEITRFSWGKYRRVGNDLVDNVGGDYITPHLELEFVIYDSTGQVFISDIPMVIEFAPDFPASPPRFRLDSDQYRAFSGTDASHHIHKGGWMCIMGGGYSSRYTTSEWNPDVDTILAGLHRAFDWIVWHQTKYGW